MAKGTIALLMLVVGALLIIAIPKLSKPTLKAIAVRLAAIAFLGAGINLVGGWAGDAIGWLVESVNSIGTQITSQAFGAGAIWVLYFALVVLWFAAMVPTSWFDYDPPDGLTISGVVLPAFAAHIPGSFGANAHQFLVTLGSTETRIVTGWFS